MTAVSTPAGALSDADRNWRRFVLFRVLFNSRFYYPVLAVLFLDLGLTPSEYTLLNFAWAIAIVFTDLPAGVLADRIGRKPLVVSSAIFMILEMALLAIAPRNGGIALLVCCFGNRILSGMAEGMASGADEALVFDSLAERGRSAEWPSVLEQVVRWQGVGLVIAMLVGGAVYDPIFMGRLSSALGFKFHFDQGLTLRFPIYLNLVTALITLWTALGLREPGTRARQCVPGDEGASGAEMTAWHLVKTAGTWIVKTPAALFVIVAGVLIDSVSRLFLTFSSTYFRIIDLPEATFGIIGAALGLLSLVVSPMARRMVTRNSMTKNYLLLGVMALAGLTGAAVRWHYWGLAFVIPIWGAMMALDYIVSYYLNNLVDSSHRATVLSFNGVAVNLGYGFISLLFALALKAVRNGGSTQEAVARGFALLPPWLLFAAILCAIAFRRQYRRLSVIPPAAEAAAP